MFRAIHIVAACAALLAGVLAEENMVIDSHGTQLNAVMRREKAKLHSQPPGPSPGGAPGGGDGGADGDADADADIPDDDGVGGPHTVNASDLTTHAPTPAPVVGATASRFSSPRDDLEYNYVEEKVPGGCEHHYQLKTSASSVDDCAKACYNTFGCTRFSAGENCAMGCRISSPGRNAPVGDPVPEDGQCQTTAEGDGGQCVTYKLAFFHAIDQPGACGNHFQKVTDAENKADCAHACKNTPGCTKFTAEPNCNGGCRISKCDENPGAVATCPDDGQCNINTGLGCTVYELFR